MTTKPRQRTFLDLTLACLLWFASMSAAESASHDPLLGGLQLTGSVVDENNEPIIGAQVFVYTAKPRQGSSSICSYCCADCEKFARTDEDGLFLLKDLDPNLQFRILTTATGYRSRYNQFVLPETGPLQIRLETSQEANIPKNRKTKGRITDLKGKPIVGAKVTVERILDENHITGYRPEGMDPFAISDANGIFIILSDTPFKSINVSIKARQHAPLLVNDMKAGTHSVLQLTPGAIVSGRIMMHGQALPAAKLILSGMNRIEGFDVGDFETLTDDSGHFSFQHLPPSTDFWLTGHIEGFAAHLKFDQKPVRTPKDLQEIDTGDFSLSIGFRFSGKLNLENGAKIPEGTRLSFTQENGADRREMAVDPEGRFDFASLPQGVYNLFVDIKGYHLSQDNPNITPFNGETLRGALEANINDFPVLLVRDRNGTEKNPLNANVATLTRPPRPFLAPVRIPDKYKPE